MPPETIPALRERLASLEARHGALDEKHQASIVDLSRRLESHMEETDRRFANVEAKHIDTHQAVTLLTSTVSDFITAHEAIEETKDKQSVKAWQIWGLVAVVILAPFLQAIFTKAFGG